MSEDLARGAEQVVLGSLMADPAAVEPAIAKLRTDDFHSVGHSTVFKHIVAAWVADEPTEPTALATRLVEAAELERAGGLAYLSTLYAAAMPAVNVAHYAGIVAEHARRRRLTFLGTRLVQAAEVEESNRRDQIVGEVHQEIASMRTTSRTACVRALDWPNFLTRELVAVDFHVGRLMVRGEQIALIGDGKAGKSLFCQEWLWRMCAGLPFLDDHARAPVRVLYVDQENTEDEIQERLLSFGATPETLANLTYLSFPGFRPLNRPAGAADLLAAVDEYRPAVVAFDTISRMVAGKENDSDPWLDLYRLTLLPLKARKVGSIRLDHFGKDQARGSRGNSAKTQDVDAVWELMPTERGSNLLRLTRTHTRTGKGSSEFLIRRHGELIGDRWKAGGTWHGLADAADMPDIVPDETQQFRPAARRVLGVLAGSSAPLSVLEIGDALAGQPDGPLKARTIQDALRTLADASRADELEHGRGKASLWTVAG